MPKLWSFLYIDRKNHENDNHRVIQFFGIILRASKFFVACFLNIGKKTFWNMTKLTKLIRNTLKRESSNCRQGLAVMKGKKATASFTYI